MRIYLATPHSFKNVHDSMRIFLAGTFPCHGETKGRLTEQIIQEREMDVFISGPHADYDGIWQKNIETPEDAMKIFLAGSCQSKRKGTDDIVTDTIDNSMIDPINAKEIQEKMKIFLAESGGCHNAYTRPAGVLNQRISILESFYYIKDWMIPYIRDYWHFLLDSGAFTFITQQQQGGKSDVDWIEYTDRYCDFIIKNNIDLFFEMDIDMIIGLKRVEQLRKRIEQRTGKQPIPVWHKSRGKDYFIQLCKDYPYVAIGGIAIKVIDPAKFKFFPWFIDKAHEHDAKIHGLGFTRLKLLPKYHFDSVDSTSWVYGNISGTIYHFNGRTIVKKKKQPGQRIKTCESAIHNFREWVKFQRYAEVNL